MQIGTNFYLNKLFFKNGIGDTCLMHFDRINGMETIIGSYHKLTSEYVGRQWGTSSDKHGI